MMRFFTPEWRDGDLSDDDYEKASALYQARLMQIRSSLPSAIEQMLTDVSLHDAQVQIAEVDGSNLRLLLRAGDLQRGYTDVDLRYDSVESLDGIPSVSDVLNSNAEIVEDEIDINSQGLMEHRLIFAPDGEIVIRFRKFAFLVTPVENREFERPHKIFVDQR
jgi:hypothetical protein